MKIVKMIVWFLLTYVGLWVVMLAARFIFSYLADGLEHALVDLRSYPNSGRLIWDGCYILILSFLCTGTAGYYGHLSKRHSENNL